MQKKFKTFLTILVTLLLCFIVGSLVEKDVKAEDTTAPKTETTSPTETNATAKPLKIKQQYTYLYTIKIKKKLWMI